MGSSPIGTPGCYPGQHPLLLPHSERHPVLPRCCLLFPVTASAVALFPVIAPLDCFLPNLLASRLSCTHPLASQQQVHPHDCFYFCGFSSFQTGPQPRLWALDIPYQPQFPSSTCLLFPTPTVFTSSCLLSTYCVRSLMLSILHGLLIVIFAPIP